MAPKPTSISSIQSADSSRNLIVAIVFVLVVVVIIARGSNEFTFVGVSIILFVDLGYTSEQTFLCEVFWVIDVNDVFHILTFLATFFNFACNLLTIINVLAEVMLDVKSLSTWVTASVINISFSHILIVVVVSLLF